MIKLICNNSFIYNTFFILMSSLMLFNTVLLTKCFLTYVTFKWFLACTAHINAKITSMQNHITQMNNNEKQLHPLIVCNQPKKAEFQFRHAYASCTQRVCLNVVPIHMTRVHHAYIHTSMTHDIAIGCTQDASKVTTCCMK